MRTEDRIELAAPAAGTSRTLTVWRWGDRGARPKAYLQASLHADELPGMLVGQHLAAMLDRAAAERGVIGEVVLVPVANPIGLSQRVHGALQGRFELARRTNFNRGFANLAEAAARTLDGQLTGDADRNVELVRAALSGAARDRLAQAPLDETDRLRAELLVLAVDADIVLDLHCDTEALLYVYLGTPTWPASADLPRCLGSGIALLAEDSGGDSFDEAAAAPWWALARRFPDHPIPPACLGSTVELRGQADVSDELASRGRRRIDAISGRSWRRRRRVRAGGGRGRGARGLCARGGGPGAHAGTGHSGEPGHSRHARAPRRRARRGDRSAGG